MFEIDNNARRLSQSEKQQYLEDGYVTGLPVFSKNAINDIHDWYEELISKLPKEIDINKTNMWHKASKKFYDLCRTPTILDYAGISVPNDMQGKSLKPIIEGGKLERKGQYYHYYEFPHGWHSVKKHYGVRTDGYKLIHYYNDSSEWELFDLNNDPHEMNNIYNDTRYSKTQKELHNLLVELRLLYKEE